MIELSTILAKHKLWLAGAPGGRRADLRGADLSYANLTGACLTDANLRGADLTDADLSGANLKIPAVDRLDARIAAAVGDGNGTLEMGAWHTCEFEANGGLKEGET